VRLALDTNAYVALQADGRALVEEVRCAEIVGLPIVVLGELWFGFMNGSRLRENTRTLERFIATPRVEVLQLDEQTTRLFGETATLLREAGEPIQQNDIWIAALCKQHGFTLATHDQGFRHVLGLGLLELPPPAQAHAKPTPQRDSAP
jgi:tRNA(fMet)-specific endonuclease VapC